ncbi:MAG: ABC transporter permease [Opitutae bacterium]
MSIWRIIFANLSYSRRQHLGTSLGLALASMVLVGSLTIGDSVRATLAYKASERLGLITHVFLSGDGYFHADLADRILKSEDFDREIKVAPVLITTGTLSSPDGRTHASGITVLGIDHSFFNFTEDSRPVPDLTRRGYWASPDLAAELETEVGARLVLRVEEPSLFSRDAPLSGERDARFVSWNRPYLGEVRPAALGNFSLRANMQPARTIFVPLSMIQEDMFASFSTNGERTDLANLLLVGTGKKSIDPLMGAMERCWTLADAGLEIKKLRSEDAWNLRSRSVFLSDRIVSAARQINPSLQGELTYLVNAIAKTEEQGDANTSLIPYSMVTGVELHPGGILGPDWEDTKIAINEWAANDQNLSVGDWISLEYFMVGDRRELIEKSRTFEVGKILPMPSKIPSGQESDWTPKFPGLSDAENCGEWDTGIPIKHKIRPQDETYWDDYRGSPKAFISLKVAEEMWENRWGKLTGLRIDGKKNAEYLNQQLQNELSPSNFGIQRLDLKKDAEQAISGPVDFSQLFLSFGFFVVLSGLSLGAMLFGFSLEQRNRQAGMLLSLGYTPRRVNLIISMEAMVVCLLGTLMGLGWAWFFGHAVLWMLNGAWGGAVSKLDIFYLPSMDSIIIGTSSSFVIGLISLFWVVRKQLQSRPVALIQGGEFLDGPNLPRKKKCWKWGWIGMEVFAWTTLVGTVLYAWFFGLPPGPSFFVCGAMVLLGGMIRFFKSQAISKPTQGRKTKDLLLHLDYRRGRKITVLGMLAVGTFLVVGAGAFRQGLPEQSNHLRSATGGFSFIMNTSLPLYDDLLSEEASELFDLSMDLLEGLSIVPLRTQEGDDASCLNLHQSKHPQLLGIPVDQVTGRFTFIDGNWTSLEEPEQSDIIMAAVDQNTLLWSLKKRVGDRITYVDGEGEKFEVELAAVIKGSFLQGGLYISEKNWQKKFPRIGGYKEFWIGGNGMIDPAMNHLQDRLYNYGARSRSTLQRLGQLRMVENTYLSIFQALGGVGVVLGTIGLFVLVLRNLWERRKEQAILGAIGFSLAQLQTIAMNENKRVIWIGLVLGFGGGLLGLIPAMIVQKQDLSLTSVLGFGASLFLFSYLSLFLSVQIGLQQHPFRSLRDE